MSTWVLLLAGLWALAVAYLRFRRIWIFYYLLGVAGFTWLGMYLAGHTGVAAAVSGWVARQATDWARVLAIPVRTFRNAPATLLIPVAAPEFRWTILEIDMECAGLVESLVYLAHLIFFPGRHLAAKAVLAAAGLAGIHLANLVRLLVIMALLHSAGQAAQVLAHAVAGRLLFFAAVTAIYWYAFTRLSLQRAVTDIGRRAA